MSQDRIHEVEAKFDRAEVHLEEVKTTIGRYMAKHFQTITGHVQFGPSGSLHMTGVWPPPPWRLPVEIGDCVHDLRSGLEHVAVHLIEANGGEASEDTTFPVMKVRAAANKAGVSPPPTICGENGARVADGARAVLDRLQPYVLGSLYDEHELWLLHKLWNHDKHRALVVDANGPLFFNNAYTASPEGFDGTVLRGTWEMTIDGPDDGAIFEFVADESEMDVKAQFSLVTCFKQGVPGEGRGVCETLTSLLDYCRGALDELTPFLATHDAPSTVGE